MTVITEHTSFNTPFITRPTAGLTAKLTAAALAILFIAYPIGGRTETPRTATELAAEIREIKKQYDARIEALEAQLSALEEKAASRAAQQSRAKKQRAEKQRTAKRRVKTRQSSDNAFNPAIGVVLNGMYSSFSADESEAPGFQFGHEGERAEEGLALGHSEVTMSSNVDDKFYGNFTLAFDTHDGETEVELEEAYIQTLPGAGLPDGLRIKAGRALWTFGYLNELHEHADDFSDRPLPYRAYLDDAYNDDGVEISYVLPTAFYGELGGGVFRGDDTPFAGSGDGREAWSAYARVGGDLGRSAAWRFGAYLLDGSAHGRSGGAHDHEEEHENEAMQTPAGGGMQAHDDDHEHAEFFSDGAFTGDTRLYGADFRYVWAPDGNNRSKEWIFQGEYFRRHEDGEYLLEDDEESLDGSSRGWYAQTVYKFAPRWRGGVRYARLEAPSDAELDHDPDAIGVMMDWTNGEFSRVRLQYNREDFADGEHDDQFILQYIMSLGAHPAHSF